MNKPTDFRSEASSADGLMIGLAAGDPGNHTWLATVLEQLPLAVSLIDSEGNITLSNGRWRKYVPAGLPSRDTDFTKRWHGFTEDGDPVPVDDWPVKQALRGRPVSGMEFRHALDDGENVWLRVSASPFVSNDGQITSAICWMEDITQRKKAEEDRRASEEELTDFFENATVPLHWVGPDGIVLRANQAELDLLGYSRDEYVGRHIADFHVDRPVIDDILDRLTRGETIRDYPARLFCKDGSIKDVIITSSARFDDGKFIHTRCFTQDVTHRKSVEEALRESEERYRAVVESQAEMVSRFRPDGEILFVNNAYARARGATPEELIGRQFWDFISEGDRAGVRAMIDQLTPESPVVTIENRFETAEGVRWTLWTNRALSFDANGRVLEAQSSGIDITDRKRAEEALRESEERFRLATAAGKVGVWDWDVTNNVVTWSPAIYEIHGIQPGEFDGSVEAFAELIHPEDRDRVQEAIERALKDGAPYELEFRAIRPDGETVWIFTQARVMPDAAGAPIRMLGGTVEITDRKRSEKALQRRLRQLQTIYRLSAAVSRAARVEEITDAALDGLIEAVNADRASVLLFDDDGVMRFKGWRGLSESYRQAVDGHTPWTPDDTDAVPITVPDVAADETLGELRETITGEGIHALAFIPLISAGRVLGKFMIYHNEPHEFTEIELQLCETIAGHVSHAIERTKAEAALRESENRFRSVFNTTPVGIVITDTEGVWLDVNQGLCDMLGVQRDQMIGSQHEEFSAPGFEEERDRIRAEFESQGFWRGELPARRPDGEMIYLDSHATITEGGLQVVVVTDITNRKLAEEALRGSEARYRQIFDSAGVSIWEQDFSQIKKRVDQLKTQGVEDIRDYLESHPDVVEEMIGLVRIIDVNQETLRVFEAEDKSVLLASLANVFTSDTRQTFIDEVVAVARGERLLQFEANAQTAKGRPITALYSVAFAGTPNPYDFVLVTVLDITERKRAQEEMEAASALKDQFLSLISHELRTPISTVLTYGTLLLRRGDTIREEDREQALNDIVSEADRLENIIENLLGLTRLNVPGSLDFKPVSLEKLVADRIDAFRRRSPARKISFDSQADIGSVDGEASLIGIVVDNLLSNATKYSPPKTRIDVILTKPDDGTVEVCVRDQGIGVDEAELPDLFEPFYRAVSGKDYSPGMGLGLATCSRIVEAHGGSIWANRNDEGGSDFRFTLPAESPN